MLRPLPFLALLALTSACVTEANFTEVASASFCDRYEECEADFFAANWDDQAACRDDASAYFLCWEDHCDTFDTKLANDCVVSWNTAECGSDDVDISDCEGTWSNCDAIGLGLCVAGVFLGQ